MKNILKLEELLMLILALYLFSFMNYSWCLFLLMFAHSSFDRVLGYGLKFTNSFRSTHLGAIGK